MAKRFKQEDVYENNIFGNLVKSANDAKASIEAVDVEAKTLAINLKKAFSGNVKIDSVKSINDINKATKESNILLKEAIKNEQEKAKYSKLAFDAQRAEERLKQESLKTEKLRNQESKKTLTSYQQESRALTEMRNRYKDLAVQKMNGVKLTRDEEKEFRRLLPTIRQTDSALKKIDASVGQFGRKVGEYPKVINGFKNALGSLGVAFGAGAFISNAKDVVVQFDNAIADLSAITGATGKDLDFFKKQAIELGVEVKGGASAVVEAYKLIASAKPELLENAAALNSVTESAILLSKASGMELPAAATALTDAMSQFGADADQAAKFVDVLAAGAKFGSAEIPQITEALLRFGAVAKTSNVNIQESTALIEDLAEKGLKGADAGTALRNVMLKLSAPDALPKDAQIRLKQLGVNFDDLRDKSKPFAERLESLKPLLNDNAALVKTFGTENAVAATTLISTTDRIKELTASVDENNIAQEQADARSKTLSEAYNRFKETINGLILEFVDGKNASGGFADALDFVRENISTILTVAKHALEVFAIYKSRIIAINVAQKLFGDGTGKMNISLRQMVSNMKDGASASSKMGTALKGVGWTAIIALATELAMEFYNIASGAKLAEERTKIFNDSIAKGTEQGIKITGKYTEALKKQMQVIDLMNISESERIIRRKQATDETKKQIEQRIKFYEKEHARIEELRLLAIKNRDKVKSERAVLGGEFGIDVIGTAQIAEAQSAVTTLTAEEKKQVAILKELRSEMNSLGDSQHNLNVESQNLTISTGKETKAVKEKTKAYKDANDQIERMVSLMKETQDLTDEIALFESEEDLQSAIESQLESIKQSGQYSLDIINARIQAEYDLRKAIIERQFIEQMDAATNEQEVIDARIRRDFELGKLDEEFVNKRKETNKQLEDAQEAHSSKLDEKTIEVAKKNYDNERKYIELTTKFWEDQIDKRIAKLNELTEASKKEQQNLQELANSGNIQAQQSIAREAEIQREAEKEKAKLEQRKLYLQAFSAFMTNYTNRLEKGEDSTQALAGAVADKAVLEAILATLPAFFDGADKLDKTGKGIDGIGGFLAINHPDERIVPKKENDQLTMNGKPIPNEMLPSIVNQWKAGIGLNMMDVKTIEKSSDQQIIQKLDELTRAVKNQPDRYPEMEQVVKGVVNLYFNEKKGNRSTRTINQYRTKG